MPLSIFNHQLRSHHKEVDGSSEFSHMFGGDPTRLGFTFTGISEAPHLLYRLNLDDPAFDVDIPGVRQLPLLYGFSYVNESGTFSYCAHSDTEIEVISVGDCLPDPDCPYENYPREFPERAVTFERQAFDPSLAEDALRLAGVFRLDHLTPEQMQRAIQLAEDQDFFSSTGFHDWTREEKIAILYDSPFLQGRPSKTCENENCTAKVVAYREPSEIVMPLDTPLIGGETIRLSGRIVREDSMRVFALHQPQPTERLLWNDPFVQLVFEFCECCKCIRVSNQCT